MHHYSCTKNTSLQGLRTCERRQRADLKCRVKNLQGFELTNMVQQCLHCWENEGKMLTQITKHVITNVSIRAAAWLVLCTSYMLRVESIFICVIMLLRWKIGFCCSTSWKGFKCSYVNYFSQTVNYYSQTVNYCSQTVNYYSQTVNYYSQTVNYCSQTVNYYSQTVNYYSQTVNYCSQDCQLL